VKEREIDMRPVRILRNWRRRHCAGQKRTAREKKVNLKEKEGSTVCNSPSPVGLQEYSRHDQGPDHEADCFLLAGMPVATTAALRRSAA
jgi:hypothetical protein